MSAFFVRKLKSVSKLAIAFGIASFGIQSIALPVHASAHALQYVIQAKGPSPSAVNSSPVAQFNESECELCDLASHSAVSPASLTTVDSVEAVSLLPESQPAAFRSGRFAILPRVRGPPTRS